MATGVQCSLFALERAVCTVSTVSLGDPLPCFPIQSMLLGSLHRFFFQWLIRGVRDVSTRPPSLNNGPAFSLLTVRVGWDLKVKDTQQ